MARARTFVVEHGQLGDSDQQPGHTQEVVVAVFICPRALAPWKEELVEDANSLEEHIEHKRTSAHRKQDTQQLSGKNLILFIKEIFYI
jgi:hypothetical protein